MTITAKLVSLGAITSGVMGTAGIIYFKPWEKKITIRKELSKLDRTILTSLKDSRWEIKAHTYTIITSKDPSLKIDNKNNITSSQLASWCINSLEKSNSEELYKKAKELCLAPFVKEKLSKENKQIVSTFADKLSGYKAHTTSDHYRIPLTETGNKQKDNLEEQDLKNWCDIGAKRELLKGTDNNYERIVKWCTA